MILSCCFENKFIHLQLLYITSKFLKPFCKKKILMAVVLAYIYCKKVLHSCKSNVNHCRLHRNECSKTFSCPVEKCQKHLSSFNGLKSHMHRSHVSAFKNTSKQQQINVKTIKCSLIFCPKKIYETFRLGETHQRAFWTRNALPLDRNALKCFAPFYLNRDAKVKILVN